MHAGIRLMAVTAALTMLLLHGLPAQAGGDDRSEKIDAAAIIDACAKSQQALYDTGGTGYIIEGLENERACLKQAILASWKALGREGNQEQFVKNLNDLEKPFLEIYDLIYQDNRNCTPCGTMNSYTGSVLLVRFYKDVLESMAEASD